jgi:diguanylate cyclase (GGDEF)-like protein/PAS domain S-box-containing protein
MADDVLRFLIIVALLLQCAAAVLAFNLIRVTGRRLTWLLIGAAAALLAVARGAVAIRAFFLLEHPAPGGVLLDLAVSLLLLAGIACIAPRARSTQKAVRALRESEARYRRMVDAAGEGIWLLDSQAVTIYANPRLAQMLGWSVDELLGRSLFDFVDSRFRAEAERNFKRHRLGVQEQFDFRFRRKDGSDLWAIFSANLLVDDQGRLLGALGVVTDVTDRMAPQRLLQAAQHDPLTGLPNRTLLADRLDQALAAARRNQCKVAVLFVDLDRFKPINDALGHRFGDLILQEVAGRLAARIRQIDTVARYGGDEFVVVLQSLTEPQEAGRLAQGFVELLGQPFVVQGERCILGGSIGISIFPEDGADAETLIRNADAAMYRVKDEGGEGYRFFSTEG